LPIYKDLSRDDLLERYLGACTQNVNENFNAIIWRLAPKHLHCGSKTIEIVAYLTAIFKGYYPTLKILKTMDLAINNKIFADLYNEKRL